MTMTDAPGSETRPNGVTRFGLACGPVLRRFVAAVPNDTFDSGDLCDQARNVRIRTHGQVVSQRNLGTRCHLLRCVRQMSAGFNFGERRGGISIQP